MANKKVKFGMPTLVTSWRDLGREGAGRHFAAGSPYARNGVYVMSSHRQGEVTRESGPGLPPARREWLENPGLKQTHDFVDANSLCIHCNMLKEGHDRQMARLVKKK